MCRENYINNGSLSSSLERFEQQLSTPRQIAMERMHCLGIITNNDSEQQQQQQQQQELLEVVCDGGLPMVLVSLLQEAVQSWSLFYMTVIVTTSSPPPQTICNSNEVKLLQRTISLLSRVTQLDPTLGEEIGRAGSSQPICSRIIEQINECMAIVTGEEDSDALIDLQDAVFEIYSPSHRPGLAFTNDELRRRLPLMYNLTPVSHHNRDDNDDSMQKNNNQAIADNEEEEYNNNNMTIFIRQVTKRQSAQADVGFVMWPSAIVLSRWLISNPTVILHGNKSVLELGAGCGLVGITAARIIQQSQSSNAESKKKQKVIITDVNELVLENITQNIKLNDVESIASVAKLDFYVQTGKNYSPGRGNKWIAGELNGEAESEREPVDVILAADIICQPEDAVAAVKTIHDALRPGGMALAVSANAEHRFGVEIFASECEQRGLEVTATDVTEMYNGQLLLEDMDSAAGYVDGMELTFFEITKR